MKSDELLIELYNYYSEWTCHTNRPEIFLMHRLAERLIRAQDLAEYYKRLYEHEVRKKDKICQD